MSAVFRNLHYFLLDATLSSFLHHHSSFPLHFSYQTLCSPRRLNILNVLR